MCVVLDIVRAALRDLAMSIGSTRVERTETSNSEKTKILSEVLQKPCKEKRKTNEPVLIWVERWSG